MDAMSAVQPDPELIRIAILSLVKRSYSKTQFYVDLTLSKTTTLYVDHPSIEQLEVIFEGIVTVKPKFVPHYPHSQVKSIYASVRDFEALGISWGNEGVNEC